MAKFDKDFQEIAHCGGRYTVQVEVKDDGNLVYSVGYHHRGAGPASFFAVYALREGIVAGTVQLGGIGDQFNDPPHPSCIPIFIASDRTGMFGHRCPQCEQYWRSRGAPSRWPMTCPYCGLLADCHDFRTDGQLKYVEECCGLINDCVTSGQPGTHCVDMDKAADKAQQEAGKPSFYYVEESQQNMYRCDACDEIFDIIGRFAYCPCCGTRNDACIAREEIEAIRREILSANSNLGNCVRNLVGVFDIFARSLSRQLVDRVPMTPARRKAWERYPFHSFDSTVTRFRADFDIDLVNGLSNERRRLGALAFNRRHLYEHKGGVVDQKYLDESGDTTVRLRQMLREDPEDVLEYSIIVSKMIENAHAGFHEIFPPHETPLSIKRR